MKITDENSLLAIAENIADEFDAPIDQVLTANLNNDGTISGALLSGGNFHTYAIDETHIGIVDHPELTEELNEYTQGLLSASYGINTDSVDDVLSYAQGFFRLDAQVRCRKGGTPCGKICLPKGAVCRKTGGGGGAKLKSPGKVGAGIAGGILAAGALGAAGAVAYGARDELARGGKAVGERIKRAGTEGYKEVEAGVKGAKEKLKETKNLTESVKKMGETAEKMVEKSPLIKPKDKEKLLRETKRENKSRENAARGAGYGAAVGDIQGGVENAGKVVGENLKAAGEDIKTTANLVGQKTKRNVKQAANAVGDFFKGNKKKKTASTNSSGNGNSSSVPAARRTR